MSAATPLALSRSDETTSDALARHGYTHKPVSRVGGVRLIVHTELDRVVCPMNWQEANRFTKALDFGLTEKQAKALATDTDETACSCGEAHPLVNGGKYIGENDDGEGGKLALFNCRFCGSTRAVAVPRIAAAPLPRATAESYAQQTLDRIAAIRRGDS